jgi:hypothetical protein
VSVMSSVPTVMVGPSLNLTEQRLSDILWGLENFTITEIKVHEKRKIKMFT